MIIPNWKNAPNGATHFDKQVELFCQRGWWWSENQKWTPSVNDSWGTDRYTPRPVEPETTAWDGTGRPPVGAECETEDFRHGWILAIVMAHDNIDDVAVCKTFYGYDGYSNFRPIRTQAQREREELIEKALAMDCHPREGLLSRHDFCGAMYDAGMLRSKHSQDDRTKLVTSLNQLRGETDVGIVADVILSIGFRLER